MPNTPYDNMLSNYFLGSLTGFVFFESSHMTITGKTKVYKTTRKWKPKKIRRVTEILPNPEVMVMGNTIVGHPITIRRLKEKLIQ